MSKSILIADDSPVIQTLSKKIFFGLGYNVKGFKTGNGVLAEIEKNDYDAIILDIILPGVDGLTLARQIRALKDSKKSQVPIVTISGNYKNYSREELDEIGINEFLLKPLDYDKLVASVQKWVGK